MRIIRPYTAEIVSNERYRVVVGQPVEQFETVWDAYHWAERQGLPRWEDIGVSNSMPIDI